MGDEQGRWGQSDELATSAAVVLDPRLAEIWQLVWAEIADDELNRNGVPLSALGALIRLAYLQGYADATLEPEPSALWDELGVRAPALSRPTASERPRAIGRARRGNSGR